MNLEYSKVEVELFLEALRVTARAWKDINRELEETFPLTYWYETQGKYDYVPKFN